MDDLRAVVLVITQEPPGSAAAFTQQEGLTFSMLRDPDREAYAAFGLQRALWRDLFNWNTIRAYARGLLSGRWPRPPHGDLAQLGGDFVLDSEGRILFAHCSQDPGDRPAIEDIVAAVHQGVKKRSKKEL